MADGVTRRQAVQLAAGAATWLASPTRAAEPAAPKRLAAVNSIYYKLSHAYHIVGRLVYGYTVKGKHHKPPFAVARMYNQQYQADGQYKDLSRPLARAKGIDLADAIPAALVGRDGKLDVDGVLLICEHGDYPQNDRGQLLYPRAEFFDQIASVFKASGRAVPVFIDKHLSYDHQKARTVYDTAKKLNIPLMAGSSLPVTWRRPEWEPEVGAKIDEVVVCYHGRHLETWAFHALETAQCLLERRRGGETGVKAVRGWSGPAVWKAWDAGEWDNALAEAALRRSPTRDYGTPRDHVETPTAVRVEYADGARATVLHLPGYVADVTAAVRLAGDPKPHATLFSLPAPPGARFFDPLTYHIEEFFRTGRPPYPVERTLLTSVALDFAMRSLADGGRPVADPALAVAYQPTDRSYFFRGPESDE